MSETQNLPLRGSQYKGEVSACTDTHVHTHRHISGHAALMCVEMYEEHRGAFRLEFEVQGGFPSAGGRVKSTCRGSRESGEVACLGSWVSPSLATWCRAEESGHGRQLGGMLSIPQDEGPFIHSLKSVFLSVKEE